MLSSHSKWRRRIVLRPHVKKGFVALAGSSTLADPTSLKLPMRNSSRFSTRYDAKKMASAIFAISPGWKLRPAKRIQMRAPLTERPRPGINGNNNKPTPIAMKM